MRVRPKLANPKMAAELDGTTSGRFWTLFYATRALSNFVLGRVLFELWSTKCPKIGYFRTLCRDWRALPVAEWQGVK